jgi:Dna[CI] antecedent, DciA
MPKLASFLVPLLDGMGLYHRCQESSALELWPQVVGPQVALHTEAERVRDGILMVRTASSTWAHELAMGFRSLYIEQLNARLGKAIIKEIRFLPPPLRKRAAQAASGAELAAQLAPDPADSAWREEVLGFVDDPELAQRFDALLRRVSSRRRARLGAGWLPCPVCQTLSPDGRVCAPCRQKARHARRVEIRRMLVSTPWLTALDVKAVLPEMTLAEYQGAKGHVLQSLRRELSTWCACHPWPERFDALHQQKALCYTMLRCGKMPHQLSHADVARALRDELTGRFPPSKAYSAESEGDLVGEVVGRTAD